MIIGGTYPTLKERTRNILQHTTIHHAMEQLGVQCGSYRCGQCHPGGKSMTLKEEQEYTMIEDKLTYKADQKK